MSHPVLESDSIYQSYAQMKKGLVVFDSVYMDTSRTRCDPSLYIVGLR